VDSVAAKIFGPAARFSAQFLRNPPAGWHIDWATHEVEPGVLNLAGTLVYRNIGVPRVWRLTGERNDDGNFTAFWPD
jgi:hypothetical protein